MFFSDKNKIEKLYYTHRNAMFSVAYEILKDKALAEDAVSESFVRVIKNLYKIEEEGSLRTRNFLIVICRNVAIDIYNSQKAEKMMAEEQEAEIIKTPEEIYIDNESVNKLIGIISNMDQKYKDVLILKKVYNMSNEEIAQVMGISVDGVIKRLQRGKKMIKEKLRREDV